MIRLVHCVRKISTKLISIGYQNWMMKKKQPTHTYWIYANEYQRVASCLKCLISAYERRTLQIQTLSKLITNRNQFYSLPNHAYIYIPIYWRRFVTLILFRYRVNRVVHHRHHHLSFREKTWREISIYSSQHPVLYCNWSWQVHSKFTCKFPIRMLIRNRQSN